MYLATPENQREEKVKLSMAAWVRSIVPLSTFIPCRRGRVAGRRGGKWYKNSKEEKGGELQRV